MKRVPRSLGATRSPLWRLVGVGGVVLALVALCSVFGGVAVADTLDDETRRIAKQLQCPVCEGVSVADSPSELAGQMRGVIRRKLEQGEGEGEIVVYFVDRYGDGVLVEPPRRGLALAVWLGPLAVLIGGAVLLARVLRSWSRSGRVSHTTPVNGAAAQADVGVVHYSPPREAAAERARHELEGFRREA